MTLKAIRNAGVIALFFLVAHPAHAQPLNGCRSGSEAAREVVEAYLSDPEWPDEQDPDVCQTLADGTSNNEWIKHFFYKAGSYYFNLALLRPRGERPDESFGGKQRLIIYDQNYELVGLYML